MVSQKSTDLPEGSSVKSMGDFVWELAATLQELNNYLQSALQATALRSSAASTAPTEAESFVIVPDAGMSADTSLVPSNPQPTNDKVPLAPGPSTSTSAATYPPTQTRWYAVIVGCHPGVFHGPSHVATNIECIPSGLALKFKTEEEANEAFDTCLRAGLVRRVTLNITESVMSYKDVYGPQQ